MLGIPLTQAAHRASLAVTNCIVMDYLTAVIGSFAPLWVLLLRLSTGMTAGFDVCLTGICACLDLLSHGLHFHSFPNTPYKDKLECNHNQQYM